MNIRLRNLRAASVVTAVAFFMTSVATAQNVEDLDSTPESAVRRFLAATAQGDGDAIERAILPHPEAAILFASEKRPPVDAKQFAAVPLQRLKQGDKVALPGGKTLVLDETHVNDERAQITSLGAPFPFIVVKVDSEWLVNADPVISGRRAAARRSKPAVPHRHRWTNDVESLKRLDAEAAIGDSMLRPPADYEFSAPIPNSWSWIGKEGEDIGAKLVVLAFDHLRPNEPPSAEESLKSTMERFSTKFSEWKMSILEMGEIGGSKFARADWAGLSASTDPQQVRTEKVHGFAYVTVDGARIVAIIHRSIEPAYRSAFHACESAALTWRKAKPE